MNCDRSGYVEEKIYTDDRVDWAANCKMVLSMSQRDLKTSGNKILGNFPNAYCYSKRMAEHLLVLNNSTNIPLVLLRPSVVGTAANEPMPGWTDSIGILQGVSLIVGMGILRDLPGKRDNIADIIPVDFVTRHILASAAYLDAQNQANGQRLLVTHCASSSVNPCTWNTFFTSVTKYQN